MLVGSNPKQPIELNEDSLLIIQKGSWTLYEVLASEDLRVEYIKERIYIQSPASYIHEEIFQNLLVKIREHILSKRLGKVIGPRFPIELGDSRRAEPDILFLSN